MPSPNDSSLVQIGHLSKAHGIRGELLLVLEVESPDLVRGELVLKPRGQGQPKKVEVERTRLHHGKLLLSLKGIGTRNDAELLCRHSVHVPKDRLPPLEEDELYLSDLPGLRVFAVTDGSCQTSGKEIGVLTSVAVPAGQELWTITTPEGKEILFPAVEHFVLSIDSEAGTAHIAPPPGLLELYLDDSDS